MATTTVTLYQFKTALASTGVITSVSQAISADPANLVNIEWNSGGTVTYGDPLSNLVQSVTGWTNTQMLNLFATAAGTSAVAPTSGTLGYMKTRVADELSRSDLTNEISYAINDAIAIYQPTRFFFNETGWGGSQFYTVNNQQTYTVSDDADLPYFYDMDDLFIVVANNNYRLLRIDPSKLTTLSYPSIKGQPYNYAWLNQTVTFYPIPDRAYQIQVSGHYKLAGPASDGETSNHWMTDAERLIRSCAKRLIYQDVILDADAAAACLAAENEAKTTLKSITSTMVRTGQIRPMVL